MREHLLDVSNCVRLLCEREMSGINIRRNFSSSWWWWHQQAKWKIDNMLQTMTASHTYRCARAHARKHTKYKNSEKVKNKMLRYDTLDVTFSVRNSTPVAWFQRYGSNYASNNALHFYRYKRVCDWSNLIVYNMLIICVVFRYQTRPIGNVTTFPIQINKFVRNLYRASPSGSAASETPLYIWSTVIIQALCMPRNRVLLNIFTTNWNNFVS